MLSTPIALGCGKSCLLHPASKYFPSSVVRSRKTQIARGIGISAHTPPAKVNAKPVNPRPDQLETSPFAFSFWSVARMMPSKF